MKSKSTKSNNIKVIVRFRPLIDIEEELEQSTTFAFTLQDDTTVQIYRDEDDSDTFTFDRIFSPGSTQSEIFEFIGAPIVDDIMNGYNGTIFAYGQTGSGKTYTMIGPDLEDPEGCGIIPRVATQILESIPGLSGTLVTLKCSMLEIYKETLRDLLGDRDKKLKIKQTPENGIYVEGLTEEYVSDVSEIMSLLNYGSSRRTVRSTRMNSQSSRSHQLFMIEVSQKLPQGIEKRGVLNLVDLAGSEKVNLSGVTGKALEEAAKINLSLSALGNIIKHLIEKSSYIPYRDSKLTRLLQESLGGNYKTSLVVNCSPHPRNTEQTISTLKFAQRAKTIENKVKQNIKQSPEALMKLIEKLREELRRAAEEILQLKLQLEEGTGSLLEKDLQAPIVSPELLPSNEDEARELLELELEQLRTKNKGLEKELDSERRKRLHAEENSSKSHQERSTLKLIWKSKDVTDSLLAAENESLKRQVASLEYYLKTMSERFVENLLKIKDSESSIDWEFLNGTENASTYLDLSEDSSTNDIVTDLPFELTVLASQDTYAQEIRLCLETNSELHPDVLCFALRKQLIRSGIINSDLCQKYYDVHWRFSVLREQYQLKCKLIKFQDQKITSLEELIEMLKESHISIVTLMSKLKTNEPEDSCRGKIIRPVAHHQAPAQDIRSSIKRFTVMPKNAKVSIKPKSSFRNTSEFSTDPVFLRELEFSLSMQSIINQNLRHGLDIAKEEKQRITEEWNSYQKEVTHCYLNEKKNWQSFLNSYRESCEKELIRKQDEIRRLNELLGRWIHLYLEGQKDPSCDLLTKFQQLTNETQNMNNQCTVQMATSSLNSAFQKPKCQLMGQRAGDNAPLLPDSP